MPLDKPADTRASHRLAIHQSLTVAVLFIGYASYYFCRSNFSVAMPMLIEELHSHGVSNSRAVVSLGSIASFGVLAYAVGKMLLASLGDFWGGRRSLLIGLAGSIIFAFLFTIGGVLPVFAVASISNRLVQSMGWAGVVKVCSKWFSYKSYGTVIGILSLSFLIGDAVARQSMGVLIQAGYGWRSLFYFAAGVAAIAFLANLFLLREARTSLGFPEPEVNQLNVFEHQPAQPNRGLRAFLRPFATNRAFWLVCFLSVGTTIVREAFNTWTPTYLHQVFHFSQAESAGKSAIFPGVGALSVLVAGWAGDRLGAGGRSAILFLGLLTTALGLFALMSLPPGEQRNLPVILIGVVAFGLLGPYSYLAGAIALDFGGRQGGATSSGLIDGFGYLGAILAGDTVARLSVALGWRSVFAALAVVTTISAIAAGVLFIYQRREIAKKYADIKLSVEQEQ